MLGLLTASLKWVSRHFLIFLAILLALAVLGKIYQEFRETPELRRNLAELEHQRALFEQGAKAHVEQAKTAAAQIGELPQQVLEERLRVVRQSLAEFDSSPRSEGSYALDVVRGDTARISARLTAKLRLQILRREEGVIQAALNTIESRSLMEQLAARERTLEAQAASLERQIADIEQRHPLLSRAERVPVLRELAGPWRRLIQARRTLASVNAERERTEAALRLSQRSHREALDHFRRSRSQLAQVAATSSELANEIEQRRAELAQRWSTRAWLAIEPLLGAAVWITLAVILAPPALKAFWYFLVAPAAERLRPIIVGRGRQEDGTCTAIIPDELLSSRGSAVSHHIVLGPGEEMIIKPEYLQSSMQEAKTDSVLVLSPAIPLGSLATGLIGLTRIRVDKRAAATISATADLFDEIGLIQVADNAGLVFKPRNLVGIVQPIGRPVRIESVWRLGQLSAWLTLQFRFLVFHGPCVLIVKGARGVAVEPATGGRRIAGDATLGWTPELSYSVRRSETFMAYLMGKQGLFNDGFSGAGKVVYEEVPRKRGKGGIFGRGLEGLGEGLLKVLGL